MTSPPGRTVEKEGTGWGFRPVAAVALVLAAGVGVAVAIVVLSRGVETEARQTDGAFAVGMILHHEMAIEMAEDAIERAERERIRELARDIAAVQAREIEQLDRIHQRLFGEPLADADHGSLGLTHEEMGMDMETSMLPGEGPFDRAFIDMMIPHHQGAVRMARVQLERGEDEELQALSRAIIAEQSREIERMNAWRERWYGAPSPAGGVPAPGERTTPSHDDMGH